MGMFEDNDIQIVGSREKLRSSLIDYAKEYLELKDVSFRKTGFLSYMINVLSVLSANNIYYASSVYREFFFLDAELPESVYNLAGWIGYTPDVASPATANILITIPLKFKDSDVNFKFPTDFKVSSGDIPYTIDESIVFDQDQSTTTLEDLYNEIKDNGVFTQVFNNKVVTVRNAKGFFYPVAIDRRGQKASFIIPFTQEISEEQTFQIPDTLEFFQFFSKEIEFSGMENNIKVYITPAGSSIEETWTRADSNSLFTMESGDKKFVWTSTSGKGEIFFGNGVIGSQPPAGSTARVVLFLTKGEDGKVAPGKLTTPDNLYYTTTVGSSSQVKTRRIKLTTTNVSAAVGGRNSPTLTEIKSKAIANLRSRERLVTEGDYEDFELIVKGVPLKNTVPILKRSDIKVNEITLFSELIYNENIVPTKNVIINTTANTTYVPKGTLYLDENASEYETLFDMTIDPLSSTAEYQYVLDNINTTPSLEFSSDFSRYSFIHIPSVNFSITRDSTAAGPENVQIFATVTEIPDEIDLFQATLVTEWNSNEFTMETNYSTESPVSVIGFSYTLTNYNEIPFGEVSFKIKINGRVSAGKHPSEIATRENISEYRTKLIIKKDLNEFMLSTITDSTAIHNVPVILSSYLLDTDSVPDPKIFELETLQNLIQKVDLKDKRMLTDFVNIKFADTTGSLTNMKYNSTTQDSVLSRSLTIIPSVPISGERYLINGNEFGIDYKDKIATWNGISWTFFTPAYLDFIEIMDENIKVIYSGNKWFEPIFNIPLQIKLIIQRDTKSSLTTSALVETVKTKLLENFTPLFGMNKNIDRSEILSVARNVNGVVYARLIEPEIDIRFDFNIKNFNIRTLLDYTPQLVAFTYESITVLTE